MYCSKSLNGQLGCPGTRTSHELHRNAKRQSAPYKESTYWNIMGDYHRGKSYLIVVITNVALKHVHLVIPRGDNLWSWPGKDSLAFSELPIICGVKVLGATRAPGCPAQDLILLYHHHPPSPFPSTPPPPIIDPPSRSSKYLSTVLYLLNSLRNPFGKL
jgi:hypothetical protein